MKSNKPQNKQIHNTILRWLGTSLSFLLLIYLLSQQGWTEIWSAVRSISSIDLGLAILLMLISRLMVCGRWFSLLRTAGQQISIKESVRLVFAGLFASNFLPTTIGGDVVRLAGAIRRGYDPSVITASLVADRLIGMAGMATLLPVGIPFILTRQGGLLFKHSSALLLSSVIPFRFKLWMEKIKVFFVSTLQSLLIWLRKPLSLVVALLWTYGHQVTLFTTVWILLRGMHESTGWLTIAGLWIFNYFITLLPVSINGMGVQELTITYFFTQFGGVSANAGLVLAVLMRLLYLIASLPGVLSLPEIMNYDRSSGIVMKQE